jgi:hypothetical protein
LAAAGGDVMTEPIKTESDPASTDEERGYRSMMFGHSWMMIACAVGVLVLVVAVAGGGVGAAAIVGGGFCMLMMVAMMAMMMGGMRHSRGHSHH